VDDDQALAERFEASRTRLRAIAYRMLGSLSDADDAVQETWLHASSADRSSVRSLDAWLTTVLARVCLDMLRWRKSRREDPLDDLGGVTDDAGPEEEAELADSVGHALLVVMDQLAPAERVAYVLHDMFSVPFEEIAAVSGRTPAAARKLASRARQRVSAPGQVRQPDLTGRSVAEAFMTAARGGDLDGLLAILDPSVVLHADAVASMSGAPRTLSGATSVAHGARIAYERARYSGLALIDGKPGLVMTARGKLRVALIFTVTGGLITVIDVVAEPARLAALDVSVL
jgi:RNA polymerase sigma factor (sigma-70 family)